MLNFQVLVLLCNTKTLQCSISSDNPVVKDQATYRYIMSMLCFCLNFLRLITKWKISIFLLLSRSESLIGHKVINRLGKGKSKIYFSGKPQRTNRLANSADLAFVLLNIQCKKTNANFYHAGDKAHYLLVSENIWPPKKFLIQFCVLFQLSQMFWSNICRWTKCQGYWSTVLASSYLSPSSLVSAQSVGFSDF